MRSIGQPGLTRERIIELDEFVKHYSTGALLPPIEFFLQPADVLVPGARLFWQRAQGSVRKLSPRRIVYMLLCRRLGRKFAQSDSLFLRRIFMRDILDDRNHVVSD